MQEHNTSNEDPNTVSMSVQVSLLNRTFTTSETSSHVSVTHNFFRLRFVHAVSLWGNRLSAAPGGSCGLTYVPGHDIPFARALDYGKFKPPRIERIDRT